jgi:hypothetical protein
MVNACAARTRLSPLDGVLAAASAPCQNMLPAPDDTVSERKIPLIVPTALNGPNVCAEELLAEATAPPAVTAGEKVIDDLA